MWNEPKPEQLAKIPELYSTEKTPLPKKQIHLHFFIGNYDWYVAEFDGEDTFWGYVDLGDPQNSEWGMFSFQELKEIKIKGVYEVDCDLYWEPKPASEITKIIHK